MQHAPRRPEGVNQSRGSAALSDITDTEDQGTRAVYLWSLDKYGAALKEPSKVV